MNYTSFIGKIIKKPKRQFVDNDIPVTKITAKFPQLNEALRVFIHVFRSGTI